MSGSQGSLFIDDDPVVASGVKEPRIAAGLEATMNPVGPSAIPSASASASSAAPVTPVGVPTPAVFRRVQSFPVSSRRRPPSARGALVLRTSAFQSPPPLPLPSGICWYCSPTMATPPLPPRMAAAPSSSRPPAQPGGDVGGPPPDAARTGRREEEGEEGAGGPGVGRWRSAGWSFVSPLAG
ncbi:hypothetical protein, variant [Pseudogymnoascus destructans 20631-21]|uniref:Uncharacterized protein n=1 Tax=Pseudogymnoascus destructans (strain ATCC MYA-4855 / 20631-21) TaxID=658429 RepID=L8GB68_PSED2|nr:hypothetical protein, variant [Pseudogymnoascus destructans 20631-21]